MKQLTGRNYVQRCVAYAIKNDIALYACHTNLDKMPNGVSFRLAQKLGLKNIQPLATEEETVYKLVTFVPNSHTEAVADALFKAGAGTIGEYETAHSKPTTAANPTAELLEKGTPNPKTGLRSSSRHATRTRP